MAFVSICVAVATVCDFESVDWIDEDGATFDVVFSPACVELDPGE